MTPQERLHKFWDLFRVYANKPGQLISQGDRIQNLLGNKQDLNKIMWACEVNKFSSHITFGTFLTKIGIKL